MKLAEKLSTTYVYVGRKHINTRKERLGMSVYIAHKQVSASVERHNPAANEKNILFIT